MNVTFLIFRGLAGLMIVCVPKAIPHLSCFLIVQKHTGMYYLRLVSTEMYIIEGQRSSNQDKLSNHQQSESPKSQEPHSYATLSRVQQLG